MLLRKATPGADSFGNTWTSEKSVVEVPDEQGVELLAIPDGGFTVVTAPEEEEPDDGDPDEDGQGDGPDGGPDGDGSDGDGSGTITEVTPPAAPADTTGRPKRAPRRTAQG